MRLLYSDETNLDPRGSKFFIYGGVSIASDRAESLSAAVQQLRPLYGYRPQDLLKFSGSERPRHITADQHRDAKQALLEAAATHEVKLFVSFVLHKLAKDPEKARRMEINRIAYHFDCYLNRVKDVGICLVDTFKDPELAALLREKFSIGIRGLPYSPTYPLKRVLGYHVAGIGSSHFSSVVDVAVGALRFAVNAMGEPAQSKTVKNLMTLLSPLWLHDQIGPKVSTTVSELSLFFSPKVIRVPPYLQEYLALHKFLSDNGAVPQQMPSHERTY